jgi:hypothetical protein
MENVQTLWGINSILLLVLGFFIRGWITKMEKKIEAKLDAVTCTERHELSSEKCEKLFRHRHATTGEVIIS